MSNIKPHIRISTTAISQHLLMMSEQLFHKFDIWKSRFPNLTWTHIYRTLRVGDDTAIRWYLGEASVQ